MTVDARIKSTCDNSLIVSCKSISSAPPIPPGIHPFVVEWDPPPSRTGSPCRHLSQGSPIRGRSHGSGDRANQFVGLHVGRPDSGFDRGRASKFGRRDGAHPPRWCSDRPLLSAATPPRPILSQRGPYRGQTRPIRRINDNRSGDGSDTTSWRLLAVHLLLPRRSNTLHGAALVMLIMPLFGWSGEG